MEIILADAVLLTRLNKGFIEWKSFRQAWVSWQVSPGKLCHFEFSYWESLCVKHSNYTKNWDHLPPVYDSNLYLILNLRKRCHSRRTGRVWLESWSSDVNICIAAKQVVSWITLIIYTPLTDKIETCRIYHVGYTEATSDGFTRCIKGIEMQHFNMMKFQTESFLLISYMVLHEQVKESTHAWTQQLQHINTECPQTPETLGLNPQFTLYIVEGLNVNCLPFCWKKVHWQ